MLKLPSGCTRLYRTLLVICFLGFPLLLPAVFSFGTPNSAQQTPTVNAQDTSSAPYPTQKFTVTVTDGKGRFIAGLTREQFAIREGKTDHALSYFKAGDAPASFAVLVDVSKSINRPTIDAAKSAVVRFIQRSHPKNEYFIGEFSSNLRGLTDWTRDAQAINDALSKLAIENGARPKPKALTALYDASLTVLDKLAHATYSKRVLLIINDGGLDNDSKHNLGDVKRKIKESHVLLYAIAIVQQGDHFLLDQAKSGELASVSGGRAYFVNSNTELYDVMAWTAIELRQQYEVGFTPIDAAQGGKWNKVKVKVTPRNKSFKNLSVRSREGYFSPPAATP